MCSGRVFVGIGLRLWEEMEVESNCVELEMVRNIFLHLQEEICH